MTALDLEEKRPFQENEWKAKRWSWGALALVLLLALAGIFGNGPLSSATVAAQGIQVKYERFWRNTSPTEIAIDLQGDASKLFISEGFWEGVEISRIDPEPDRVRLVTGGRELEFATSGDAAARIRLHFTPRTAGRMETEIRGGAASETVAFAPFVYP